MNWMDGLLSGIGGGLVFLIQFFLAYFAYKGAKELTSRSKCPSWKAFTYAFGAIAVLAIFAATILGEEPVESNFDPTERVEHEQVFMPTMAQRFESGGRIFIILGVPAFIGTYLGLRDPRHRIPDNKANPSIHT